jgi:hypothetical protein
MDILGFQIRYRLNFEKIEPEYQKDRVSAQKHVLPEIENAAPALVFARRRGGGVCQLKSVA